MVKKERRKRKLKKKIWMAPLFIGIALIVIWIIFYYNPQTNKKSLTEYFGFSEISALATAVPGTNNTVIRISLLYFELTPIGGDAHNVVVFVQGMTDPTDYYYPEILNGTAQPQEINLQSAIQTVKQEAGFPVKVKIRSDETGEGNITLYIPEEEVILG
jgi:hypothetical protein